MLKSLFSCGEYVKVNLKPNWFSFWRRESGLRTVAQSANESTQRNSSSLTSTFIETSSEPLGSSLIFMERWNGFSSRKNLTLLSNLMRISSALGSCLPRIAEPKVTRLRSFSKIFGFSTNVSFVSETSLMRRNLST